MDVCSETGRLHQAQQTQLMITAEPRLVQAPLGTMSTLSRGVHPGFLSPSYAHEPPAFETSLLYGSQTTEMGSLIFMYMQHTCV